MNAVEMKLADWARGRGINFSFAYAQMIPGDCEAAADQLKFAREHKAQEEVTCVDFWLRLLEKRGAQQ